MRVLFWTHAFWPTIGGVQIFAAKLVPALRERGYEITVVTSQGGPDRPPQDQYKGIPIYRFPFGDTNTYTNIDQLMMIRQQVAQLKRTLASDLIHMNYASDPSDFFHLTTAKAHPAPLLATLHGEWPEGHSAFVKHLLHTAAWVVGCSAAILDKGRQLVPSIIPRSSIIYNGLDVPPLSSLILPIEAPRLLCLGRLSPEKGFDLAVTAFATLARRFPQVQLVIVGDGPERLKLQQQIADVGLASRITLMGAVPPDQVPALLNTVTIVLIPSRQESFGLVALEAALMARPVVATRVGGLPEVIVHGETGFLVESENSAALAEALALLLAHPETGIRMGQAARRRAIAHFNWERHVDAYASLYQELTEQPKDQRERRPS
jgi:glycogen(starch) synthase